MDHVGMTLTPPLRYRGFLGRFTALSTVVRALAPSVSFLEYESVLDKVERDSYTEREYYGNETTYEYQRISVRDLWGILSQCMAL